MENAAQPLAIVTRARLTIARGGDQVELPGLDSEALQGGVVFVTCDDDK